MNGVIDENGNVVLEKKGEEHQVARTAGESRETIPGSVTIHNHPNGGTFSDADIRDFGYGARAIYVASPEGTYRLVNTKYDTNDRYNGWVEMQEAYKAQVGQERSSLYYRDKAKATPTAKRLNAQMEKTSQAWVEARKQGKSESVLDSYKKQYDKLADQYTAYMKAETRRQEVAPADNFFRKNASKYGFSYSFG